MNNRTLFSDYLTLIGVPHTVFYSSERFTSYPPKLALTAIGDLLAEYGVETSETAEGSAPDPASRPLPMVAALKDGRYAIVTVVDTGPAGMTMMYTRGHRYESIPTREFADSWSGRSISAVKTSGACEPHLGQHRLTAGAYMARRWILALGLAFLAIYCFISNGLYLSWGHVALTALYGTGIYISYLLVLKQSGAHSSAADRMCGLIQSRGCSTVLETKAARLFGLYPWCEVGLAYFSVSLGILLTAPECSRWLAAISVCCLPYTLWSVSYQKWKAHAWCTLCLTIQALMWVIFIVMLASGQFGRLLPLTWTPAVLGACYLCVFFTINYILPQIFDYERM